MDPLTIGLASSALSGLTSGIGGMIGGSAASRAAAQQRAAIQQGIDFSQGMYDKSAASFQPYQQAGTQALGQYQGMLEGQQQPEFGYQQQEFQFDRWKDPSVANAIQEANKALEASAMAKGGMGGGLAKALQENTANIANKGYTSAFDRWKQNSEMMSKQAEDKYKRNYEYQSDRLKNYGGLAQSGMDASKTMAELGSGLAQSVSGMYGDMGNASAQGTIGQSNSALGALSGLSGAVNTGLGALGKPQGSNPWQSYFDNASSNLLGGR
jgi:hypothetical protein